MLGTVETIIILKLLPIVQISSISFRWDMTATDRQIHWGLLLLLAKMDCCLLGYDTVSGKHIMKAVRPCHLSDFTM